MNFSRDSKPKYILLAIIFNAQFEKEIAKSAL